jgi:outer membrane protein OmpA-like peptidoglycan-associated protein
MGNGINSIYDEKAPYLTKGGSVLFFSSNHVNGLGGFDVFASRYDLNSGTWTERVQLGQPINSSKDDIDPMVSNDGNQLLFSSNRTEGFGGYDIYVAYFKEQITDQFNYIEDLPMFADRSMEAPVKDENPVKQATSVGVKSFAIAPLYFTNDEDVLSPNNQIMLKTIRNLMESFPETRLTIIGHSAVDKQKETALFFTIKRAERVAATLVSTGISADRIDVCSYGSTFPMVINDSRYNTRLELLPGNVNLLSTEIIEDLPVLNQDVKSPAYATYMDGRKSLVYKVRFTTARQMVRSDVLLEFPYMSVIKNNQGEYEYLCGYETRYEDARLLKQKLQEKGYTAARVIPFEGHRALNAADAALRVQVYPDLQSFLSSEK